MPLADARAMYSGITVTDADPEADRNLLETIADWCDRYTPLVGLDPPDGVILDITGAAHLFGGEPKLARDVCSALPRKGLPMRAPARPTGVGAAWGGGALRQSGDHRSGQDKRSPDAACFWRHCGLPPRLWQRWLNWGLRTIGDIVARPRAPLAARFGEALLARLDQALGDAEEPISPHTPLASYSVEQGFPEPLSRDAVARRSERADGAAMRAAGKTR